MPVKLAAVAQSWEVAPPRPAPAAAAADPPRQSDAGHGQTEQPGGFENWRIQKRRPLLPCRLTTNFSSEANSRSIGRFFETKFAGFSFGVVRSVMRRRGYGARHYNNPVRGHYVGRPDQPYRFPMTFICTCNAANASEEVIDSLSGNPRKIQTETQRRLDTHPSTSDNSTHHEIPKPSCCSAAPGVGQRDPGQKSSAPFLTSFIALGGDVLSQPQEPTAP